MTETPDKLLAYQAERDQMLRQQLVIMADDLDAKDREIAAQAARIEKLEADLTWIYDNADNEGVEVGSVCSCSLISQIKERAQTALKEAESE